MGSQWLLSWTTTGKARLRSLFLIIKLILVLSWTRGNTRVEKVDYFASFSCFLTNVSSQINWWDSPTHLPLSVLHGTAGCIQHLRTRCFILRTFVGEGFIVLPRNSYIFNLPILEIAYKWIACYLMSSSLKSLGCLGLIMHSKVSLCEPERTVITACYHRGATVVSIICPHTYVLSLKSFLFSDVPLHSDQGDISRSPRKPFRNGNCLGYLIGVFDQYSIGLW